MQAMPGPTHWPVPSHRSPAAQPSPSSQAAPATTGGYWQIPAWQRPADWQDEGGTSHLTPRQGSSRQKPASHPLAQVTSAIA